jgi:hypothetical protein
MTIKKMLVLLGAAMALVAFAAPAMAQAEDKWSIEGESELTGTLTSTSGALAVTCEVHAVVDFWNETTATAEVTSFVITAATCKTTVDKFGCTIKTAGPIGAPWHVDVATGEGGINITEAGFFNEFTGTNCALVGIPAGVALPATGDATGTWNNATSCIDFNESGDLVGVKGEVLLDGSVCASNGITLE